MHPLKIYLASPFFNAEELQYVKNAETILTAKGFDLFSPRLHECRDAEVGSTQWAETLFRGDVAAIDDCDAVVLLYHGNYSDSGTAWECGYAFGKGKPVIVVHLGDMANIMIHRSARANIRWDELSTYDFEHLPVIDYTGDMT